MPILDWLSQKFLKKTRSKKNKDAIIIPRSKHIISRANISKNALNILYRLEKNGYQAYLVGGGVRDLLAELHPKDFDITTNATPEQIKKLFRNCRLIGRRFRLAHVFFSGDIIEVATFRAAPTQNHKHRWQTNSGLVLRDNVYGSLEEDAWRRDFTVNALYYSIKDFSITDYTGGLHDLKNKKIRIIGDASERYKEDPPRMLRAIRFACKLDFDLEEKTAEPLQALGHLLKQIPSARLFEETRKIFQSGHSLKAFNLLRQYKLLSYLFPFTDQCFNNQSQWIYHRFINLALQNTDDRLANEKTVTPAFLYAVLLWPEVQNQLDHHKKKKRFRVFPALAKISDQVISEQINYTAIPKRLSHASKDIWMLQYHLQNRHGNKAWHTLKHPRFRAGYDFLLLRAEAGEPVEKQAQWWTTFQKAKKAVQEKMVDEINQEHAATQRKEKPHSD